VNINGVVPLSILECLNQRWPVGIQANVTGTLGFLKCLCQRLGVCLGLGFRELRHNVDVAKFPPCP
jgi:hypothetical protein